MKMRDYRMTARADAVETTRQRILDAAFRLFGERDFGDVPLTDIAESAGTTVQTVLRHFDSKTGVLDALIERESADVMADRDRIAIGDVDGVIDYLARHYGADGDGVLRLLAAESRSELAAKAVARGRALHRQWVARTFAPWLERLEPRPRRRRVELLVAATDVYTWKILCRDGGLDDTEYRLALRELIRSINGGS
jgi:AcrR family transcriptional regulator